MVSNSTYVKSFSVGLYNSFYTMAVYIEACIKSQFSGICGLQLCSPVP